MSKKDSKKSKGKSGDTGPGIKVVARNRRARHEYDLMDQFEAGLVLTGTEVKSLRNGKANLEDAYAAIESGEVWLHGCDIPEYVQAHQMNHKPKRPRKLLLHRNEIEKLRGKASERGLTIVPLQLYFKSGRAKIEIRIAKGRKLHDKRQAIKAQESKREIDRALRRR